MSTKSCSGQRRAVLAPADSTSRRLVAGQRPSRRSSVVDLTVTWVVGRRCWKDRGRAAAGGPAGRAARARVRYVACATSDVLSRADDAVDALLDTWEPRQVALLTTKHRHTVHAEKVRHDGDEGYWEAFFADDDVFYGTVSGFKGLERTCVVLAVNGFSAEARAKEMPYVGLSSACSQLVVVGDLDEIAPTASRGGVRKRLTDAQVWQPPLPG